jgi:hypothetical protein
MGSCFHAGGSLGAEIVTSTGGSDQPGICSPGPSHELTVSQAARISSSGSNKMNGRQ